MRLFPVLFLIFISIPLLEIYLLIKVGSHVGAMITILLVVGTAVLGAALLRMQGISTLNRVREEMEAGRLPAVPMLEGLVLLLAGALLLTPGFFTDALGFLLLIPPLRRNLVNEVIKAGMFKAASSANVQSPTQQKKPGRSSYGARTYEGEFRRDDE